MRYTEVDFLIAPTDPWRELLMVELMEHGYEGFEETTHGLKAFLPTADFDRALLDGLIQVIATDHAPHAPLEKECELAEALPGMIGLETALPLVLALVRDGVLTRRRAVEALTTGPARVLGRSATLTDASDLTVIDPEHAWTPSRETLRSKSTNTLLLGREVQGAARLTIVRGRVVFDRATAGA